MKWTNRLKTLKAAYLGEARGDGALACSIAGYKMPAQAWLNFKKRQPQEAARWEEEFRDQLIMKGREIDERLAALARDPSHRDHYKALEALAKMSGKFKDTVIVIDRKKLDAEFDELVSTMLAAKQAQHAGNKPEAGN